MRDARRRPYVDRVRPGNKAGGAPERGAGIGATWSRGPLAGCDRGADQARRFERRSMRVTGGQIPEGPSFAPRRAPSSGMRPQSCAQARGFNPARLARCGVAPTPKAQALLRPPRAVLAATRVGRGDLGAYCCRSPLQYRHIAAGDPPKSASHIAAVAHVPIYEIGSNDRIRRAEPSRGSRRSIHRQRRRT
jgi:hypothetical protein